MMAKPSPPAACCLLLLLLLLPLRCGSQLAVNRDQQPLHLCHNTLLRQRTAADWSTTMDMTRLLPAFFSSW
jgi:hypothetical protein